MGGSELLRVLLEPRADVTLPQPLGPASWLAVNIPLTLPDFPPDSECQPASQPRGLLLLLLWPLTINAWWVCCLLLQASGCSACCSTTRSVAWGTTRPGPTTTTTTNNNHRTKRGPPAPQRPHLGSTRRGHEAGSSSRPEDAATTTTRSKGRGWQMTAAVAAAARGTGPVCSTAECEPHQPPPPPPRPCPPPLPPPPPRRRPSPSSRAPSASRPEGRGGRLRGRPVAHALAQSLAGRQALPGGRQPTGRGVGCGQAGGMSS